MLVVEDSIVNQRLTLALLERSGYHVQIAGNGREAVRLLCDEARTYDAVLMDCHMPEMDGFEASATIRAHDGPNRDIVIIALTGTLEETQIFRCEHSGMDDYLEKPIKIESFEKAFTHCKQEKADELAAKSATESDNHREPFWEEERLDKLRATMGDEADEFIGEMLGMFLADAPRMVTSVETAMDTADAPALLEAAHRIKGASRNLGLNRIAGVCLKLEEMGKSGELAAARYWYKRLKSLTNQVADKARNEQGISLPA